MGPNVAMSLQNLEMVEAKQKLSRPNRPTKEEIDREPALLTEHQFSCDVYREERKQVNKKKEHLDMGLKQACFVTKGQCTPATLQKLEANKDCEEVHTKHDAIEMLK